MRFSVRAPLACLLLSLLFPACFGDDPPAGTSRPVDAGGERRDDSGSAFDAGGGADQEAGPPACSRIEVTTLAGTGAAGLVEGPGATVQFDNPQGIAVGPDGTLFVADSNNKRIRRVLSDGTTSTFASHPTNLLSAYRLVYRSGDLWVIDRTNDALVRITPGAPPTVGINYQVGALAAVGTSPAGSMYVTQTQNCYISKMNESFNASALFSGGDPDCGSADGIATAARFSSQVLDFAFDGTTIYVADTGNFRIRTVNELDGAVTTLAGSTQGHLDGTGDAAQLDGPTGLAVDPQTHILYVADNTTIRAVTPAGVVTTLVGTTSGFDDGTGCVAKFGELRGIVYYAGALYAVDVNRVRKVELP